MHVDKRAKLVTQRDSRNPFAQCGNGRMVLAGLPSGCAVDRLWAVKAELVVVPNLFVAHVASLPRRVLAATHKTESVT